MGLFEIAGLGTVVVAWVVAVLVVGAVLRWWAVLGRPGVATVLARLAAMLLVLVTVVAAVGVSVNRAGLWFVSWRDLGSVVTGPNPGDLIQHGADPRAAVGSNVGPWGATGVTASTVGAPTADSHTPLRTYRVAGTASRYTGVVHVWQAPGEPGPHGRPVIELFHGYPVSPQSGFANLDLQTHVGAHVPGALVLVPDWSPGEIDTECVDGPDLRMETWLTRDVPAWAVATLGATSDRGSWATLGYSAGGWCATAMALRHPQTYAAGISLGGAARPEFAGPYAPVETHGGEYDLPALMARRPAPVALLVQYSDLDAYAAPSNDALIAGTRSPLSVTRWSTPDSGHRVGAWAPMVPEALTWLRRTAPAFA